MINTNLEVKYERLLERQRLLKKSNKETKDNIKRLKEEIKDLKIVFHLFSSVITSARKLVIIKLRKIITPVVRYIFVNRNFSFDIQYKKVGTSHRYLPIIREGKKIRIPKYESGGGIIPVLDFTLRIALLKLGSKDSRMVLFLDEPFGWLGGLSHRATDVITKLSRKLKLQFIINTHDTSLANFADKRWHIEYHNGISYVREIKK